MTYRQRGRVLNDAARTWHDPYRPYDLVKEATIALAAVTALCIVLARAGRNPSLEIIPQLRATSPETQIVVLTMQENPAFARAALRAGAIGYLLKDAADDELMEAIEAAAVGRSYLNPQLGARLAATSTESEHPAGRLSPREREVLTLIALGHTNPEIAESLSLSVRTVESHRAHIQQKTNLTSRADLVAYAHLHGLVQ